MKNELKLGHLATDKITGASGVVVCVSHWSKGKFSAESIERWYAYRLYYP